jgi:hypothetical protein
VLDPNYVVSFQEREGDELAYALKKEVAVDHFSSDRAKLTGHMKTR